MRKFRDSGAFAGSPNAALTQAMQVPDIEIYAIDVSFPALEDKALFDYLNDLPTSFVLPGEAVDRLRGAAGTIIEQSPEYQRLLKDIGATVVPRAVVAPAVTRQSP